MSAPAEIVERIKKLLRLARSANPHEAQLAMQRALQLAEEHRVAVDALNPDAMAPLLTHQDTDSLARLGYDRRFAAIITQRFFRVRPVVRFAVHVVDGWPRGGEKLSFVGTASDIEIALYVYHFLVRHFGYCWRLHRGRLRNRYSYVHGMFEGLYTKLADAEPPAAERKARGTELALSMDGYIAQHIGETSSKGMADPSAAAARYAGYIRGRQTEIRNAVKAPAEQTLALA
ncbi:MAG: DUF2786 domain-containing protein [Verrucomicrobia bacterium]|nr:DUF2786 domain-containing protein [Verrucomicrobiota bacterium]